MLYVALACHLCFGYLDAALLLIWNPNLGREERNKGSCALCSVNCYRFY